MRKSIHAIELLEDKNRLEAAYVTRWKSQIKMIKTVLSVPDKKLSKLDTNDRTFLQERCAISDPFENATVLIQRILSASHKSLWD